MCLAVPGLLVDWIEREAPFHLATVEFAGIRRHVHMACVPEARVGDYVLVHAGIAISRIDAAEAARVFALLEELDLNEEADPGEVDPRPLRDERGHAP